LGDEGYTPGMGYDSWRFEEAKQRMELMEVNCMLFYEGICNDCNWCLK
jgi:hypothetical protein